MVTLNGKKYETDLVVNMMDDEIRENLHSQGFDNDQEFVDAYLAAHKEKHGEDFAIN